VIGQLALDQEFQCLERRRMHPWPEFLLAVLKITATLNQFRRFGISLKVFLPIMSQESRDAREGFLNLAISAVKTRLAREDEENFSGEKKRPDIVGLMLREMKNSEKLSVSSRCLSVTRERIDWSLGG